MIRAHRIALDPTVEQQVAFAKACSVARFSWNWALAEWKRQYAAGEKPSATKLQKQWNALKEEKFPWVYESPKDANQRPFANLDKAFSKFFKKTAKYPRFKKKGKRDSFYASNDRLRIAEKCVRLPFIGEVNTHEPLRFTGKIMSGVVSREAQRWFISIAVEVPELEPLPRIQKTIGIDLGLKTAVVCSDGQTFDAPKPLAAHLRRLRRRSKEVSRKVRGSNNRWKAVQRLSRLHARIKNIRKDWTHKVTTKLIRENQAVCFEDLNVRGMTQNRCLSRAISDIGWFEFRRQLEYKAVWYGRQAVAVSRWFPSTKTCSRCGVVRDGMQLSEREFVCLACGFTQDRDLNAALNIHTAGLAEIHACGPEGSGSEHKLKAKPRRVEAGTKPEGQSHVSTN
jgi:putative transposase